MEIMTTLKPGVSLIELSKSFNPAPGSAMIDVGCGKGRHSKYLASKGFRLTGMDLSVSSINEAKKFSSPSLEFIQQDMRARFGKEQYDYVLSFFTSFGYFRNEEENHTVIRNMSEALKPNGRLVLDYLNVAYSEERLVAREEKEIDGTFFSIRRWTDASHFYKEIKITGDALSEPLIYTEKVSKFSLEHFEYMFALQDLEIEKVYGDYNLNPYDQKESPRLIVIANKNA
jgi:cyclopropane fatty-acyl-phospholipid synthase-like methyltransferase